jgi:hypothetical protein
MTSTIAATRQIGKSTGAENCRRSGKPLPLISAIARVAQALWPSKTDMELAARADASPRMARYWLAERYDLSADHLAALLRSDDGLKFLEAVMGDARPAWWSRFKRQTDLANLRANIERQRRALERLEIETAD